MKGLNVFETTKDSAGPEFDGLKVRLGGDFTLQFQAIDHSTSSGDTLATMGNNFNLPTANLNLDVQLLDGMRVNMNTYLSSRHHREAWVKGGYIQVDNLNFIKQDFLKSLTDMMTIKVGLDEINYGDAHFRRSDNARAFYNPFVGNFLMDGFSTEAFGEVNLQKKDFLLVLGLSNGNLNQTTVKGNKDLKTSLYGKLGYDGQLNDDLRVRLTGSFFSSPSYDNGQYLYTADRTGARYYNVMRVYDANDNFRSGRFAPGLWSYTAIMVSPFVKWKGLEFFGLFETVSGDVSKVVTGGSFTHIGAELIYRLLDDRVYLGGRYNSVAGKSSSAAGDTNVDRLNIGAGWFLTDNVVMKAEYVNQNYTGNGWVGTTYEGGIPLVRLWKRASLSKPSPII